MKNLTRTLLTLLSAVVLLSLTTSMNAQDKKDIEKVLAPFPKAEEGMVRHVIELKKKSDESLYKVEIIPGKEMSVDCNIHRLMGTLTEKDLEGWGYTYYEFKSNGQTTSTMMACNKPNEDKFVSGETLIVRYNSKLPIVIYAPKGFEVKYRIWKADKEKNSVEK
ncbi:serine protease inhibitor ecotin [Dysgonomonas sp. Marseille-P4677]|uniref:serine protease inhibitor ecotin n=1 Tax=Dysgonomonas sp. Marseille-P4677 TaxID=2364790 RepID=UPI0019126695|nr:serine protease inhibitor ecotin [Dysgonomonas sp. Marseille-P4677]MBK5722482.1 serine protease inhibitor ecotin [Dysgonomonas sp. Marseille-P4677]